MGEKTERATGKRRNEERKKGNVFKSQEITTLLSLLATVYAIQLLGNFIMGELALGFDTFWAQAGVQRSFTQATVTSIYTRVLPIFAICAMPPLLISIIVNVIATVAQTKGLVTFSKLKPNFKALNPIQGIKKLFSVRGLVELLKSILKIVILGNSVYSEYQARFEMFPRLMEMEFVQVFAFTVDFVMSVVTSTALIFAFVAAADYIYQRWQYEKDIRMSKEEIKQEYKQTEGDPKIKGKIRQKQRQMAMSRMMQSVPEADVVIRNPTHYAVAVRYEVGKNAAPMVLAKGANLIALRIVKMAEENGVMVVENKPLARGVYENVPIDAEVPPKFFQPIAEVLAFVYSTTKKDKMPKQKKPERKAPPRNLEIAPDRMI